ncbi:ovochymase-2 [Polymixia lowei]
MDHSLRVVGGTEAAYGSHPWLVSLRNKGAHFCGGSVLSDRWILTAAHCFVSFSKDFLSGVRVMVGEFDRTVHDEEEQIFLIKNISVHEKYQHALPMSYDIALLELHDPIRLGARVQPVCLPLPSGNVPPKTSCIVGGWGRMRERGRLPAVLREVQLELVEPARCKHVLQTVRTSLQNPDQPRSALTVLCAGPERGGKDACQGDSGGPLVCPAPGGGRWLALGVTSWGKGCGRSWGNNRSRPPSRRGSPGVFTDVSLLLPWIKNKLREANGQYKGRTVSRLCSVIDGPVTGSEGVIRNPALPDHHYDNNELCSWVISVPPGYSILLEFEHLDLENDPRCLYDRLTVSVGARRPVGILCGTALPAPVLLNNSQSATLFFSSDISITGSGFVVRHRAVQGHPAPGCRTVVLVEDQNGVYSPNYPESYSNDSVCRWVIYAPPGHVVKLDFVDFDLEDSDGCLYDSLSVLGDIEGTEEIAVLCGSSLPPPVLSHASVMMLLFTSDSSVTRRGFHATPAFISHADLREQEITDTEEKTDGHRDRQRQTDGQTHGQTDGRIHGQTDGQTDGQTHGQRDGQTDGQRDGQTGQQGDLPANLRHVMSHEPCGMAHPHAVVPGVDDGGPAVEEAAQRRALPWMVHLHLDTEHLCSGILIQTFWILTSAHCTIGLQERSFSRLSALTAGPDRQRHHISRVIHHPLYNPTFCDYDAALLQLSSPLLLTEHVQTIHLPNHNVEQEATPIQVCTVSGWAEPAGDQDNITVYNHQVSLLSRADCEKHYPAGLRDRMLCVTPTPQDQPQDQFLIIKIHNVDTVQTFQASSLKSQPK